MNMKIKWFADSPNIARNSTTGEICVSHNHCRTIKYESYPKRRSLLLEIEESTTAIRGCIAFFKTYANDKNLSTSERALAASVVAEDESRLEEFQRHKPSSCIIL